MNKTRALMLVSVAAALVLLVGLSARLSWVSDASDVPADDLTLSDAVAAGDLDRAGSLLDEGADPDEPVVGGFTPLMRAAIRNDASMVRLLVDAGADIDATVVKGIAATHVAAQRDASEALAVLVDAGANVDVRSDNGMSTLDHAAATNGVGVITFLAAAGADLDVQSEMVTQGHGYPGDTGPTALAIASRAGHIESVSTLLALGADANALSATGQSPLLLAIYAGQPPELISHLLDAGADPTIVAACQTRCSYDEGDALTWAQRLGDPDTIPLIEAALGR